MNQSTKSPDPSAPQEPALVVISHYNAWPADHLIALLDQIKTMPANYPFACGVVVNQANKNPLELPERHQDVQILYRENLGMNIGAWDLGWRQPPAYPFYLFLQEECQILRPDWLAPFISRAADPRVGLVGESYYWQAFPWARLARYYYDLPFRNLIGGKKVPTSEGSASRSLISESPLARPASISNPSFSAPVAMSCSRSMDFTSARIMPTPSYPKLPSPKKCLRELLKLSRSPSSPSATSAILSGNSSALRFSRL